MTTAQWQAVSELFSSEYGIYSPSSPMRAGLILDAKNSRVNTGFFVNHEGVRESSVNGHLGQLDKGEEWLAAVFREQPLDDFAAYRNMVETSSDFVVHAYAHKPQASEPWAKEADSEIETVPKLIPDISPNSRIVDFGAGSGRHLTALRKRGFAEELSEKDGKEILVASRRILKGGEK